MQCLHHHYIPFEQSSPKIPHLSLCSPIPVLWRSQGSDMQVHSISCGTTISTRSKINEMIRHPSLIAGSVLDLHKWDWYSCSLHIYLRTLSAQDQRLWWCTCWSHNPYQIFCYNMPGIMAFLLSYHNIWGGGVLCVWCFIHILLVVVSPFALAAHFMNCKHTCKQQQTPSAPFQSLP